MDYGIWEDTQSKRRKRYRHILWASHLLSLPLKGDAYRGRTGDLREDVIRDVSLYVLAPAMNDFVLWVLGSALKKGHRRLYFLARDGYFMYKTALAYCDRLGLDIDCRYLSCSRYSVRLPMYHLDMDEALDYICRGGIDVTFNKILSRAGLDESAKEGIGRGLTDKWDKMGIIPYAKLAELKADLSNNEFFKKSVEDISRGKYPLLRDYLQGEGLLDDIPYALVDSGWTGSMQKVLRRLVDNIKKDTGKGIVPTDIKGYYWGLYELPEDVDTKDYYCYYFGPGYGAKRKAGFSNCLFEGIFSAPHGMTLGYKKEYGDVTGNETEKVQVFPVYAQIRDTNLEFNRMTEEFISEYTVRLCEIIYKKMLKNSSHKTDTNTSFLKVISGMRTKRSECGSGICGLTGGKVSVERETVRRLLETFMSTPTIREAVVYGDLPFSDDVLDENEQQMAAPMTLDELKSNHPWIKAAIMLGVVKGKLRESAWYEGSAVRNGQEVKRNLIAYRIYKMMIYAKKEVVRIKGKLSGK